MDVVSASCLECAGEMVQHEFRKAGGAEAAQRVDKDDAACGAAERRSKEGLGQDGVHGEEIGERGFAAS